MLPFPGNNTTLQVPYFKLYSQYCSNFPYAEEWLRENKSRGLKSYLKSCEKVCKRAFDLGSLAGFEGYRR